MECVFIPDTWYGKPLDTREKVENCRLGYKDVKGKFFPGITVLNAMGEEMLLPHKIYRSSELERRFLVLSSGFLNGGIIFLKINEWESLLRLQLKSRIISI